MNWSQHVRLLKPYYVALAIFAVGRLAMGPAGVEYAYGHQVFSLVILTALASLFFSAFARAAYGYGVVQAMALSAVLSASTQVVIAALTLLSYGLGQTYYNHPVALNVMPWADYLPLVVAGTAPDPVSFGRAMGTRLFGLFANTITAAVIGALGWTFGALLPERR